MVFKDYSLTTDTTVKWPQYVAGLAAAGGAFAVGTALGWPAPAGPRLLVDGGDERYFEITQNQFEWAAATINVGCAVSCLPIGILMKTFGRKWTMISLVVPFLIGWGLVIWAQNFVMLLIGRFMLGLAGGAFCVSAPQYSSEIAEKEVRGLLGTFLNLMINGGILFVYIVGAFTTVFWLSVSAGIVPIVFGLIFFFMPESPAYFIAEKREPDARKTYEWLRGSKFDPQEEIDELKREMEDSQGNQITFGQAIKKTAAKRALVIGFGLMFFQQVSGINVVIFYSTIIFEVRLENFAFSQLLIVELLQVADTGIDSDIETIIVGVVIVFSTLFGTFLVDRLGRKALLGFSSAGMSLMLAALGTYFFFLDSESDVVDNLGWIPITSLSIFLFSYSVGYGALPWLMLSEIYSKDYNAVASPITGSFCWLLSFAITATFGYISDAIGIGPTFWIFAGLSFLGFFFSVFVVVETKAKTMTEIQKILGGEKL